jgi:hypothetical protein
VCPGRHSQSAQITDLTAQTGLVVGTVQRAINIPKARTGADHA